VIRIGIAVVGCAFLLGGCGGSSDDQPGVPSDATRAGIQQARTTARQYADALRDGNGETICSLLVAEVKDGIGMSDEQCVANWSQGSDDLGQLKQVILLEPDYARSFWTRSDYEDLRLEDGTWHIDPRH
jgi:hypothetical protein